MFSISPCFWTGLVIVNTFYPFNFLSCLFLFPLFSSFSKLLNFYNWCQHILNLKSPFIFPLSDFVCVWLGRGGCWNNILLPFSRTTSVHFLVFSLVSMLPRGPEPFQFSFSKGTVSCLGEQLRAGVRGGQLLLKESFYLLFCWQPQPSAVHRTWSLQSLNFLCSEHKRSCVLLAVLCAGGRFQCPSLHYRCGPLPLTAFSLLSFCLSLGIEAGVYSFLSFLE